MVILFVACDVLFVRHLIDNNRVIPLLQVIDALPN